MRLAVFARIRWIAQTRVVVVVKHSRSTLTAIVARIRVARIAWLFAQSASKTIGTQTRETCVDERLFVDIGNLGNR